MIKDKREIDCLLCNYDGPKENLIQQDVFVSYTCPKCGAYIFDHIRSEHHD
jgi:predicted RNA-binding Zn-ribbon protein involved in translation (DUF1610 family)